MNQVLLFLALGTGVGALYASLALGLVVAHRGSGLVSLAHGTIALTTAYVYSELRQTGRLMIPPLPNPLAVAAAASNSWFGTAWSAPTWPTFVSLGGRLTTPSAILVALLYAAALGLAIHALVFRPLRAAPPLAKIVASVGLIVVLQSVIGLRFGSGGRSVDSVLPTGNVHLWFGGVPIDHFWLVGIIVVSTLALYGLYKWTRFGLASRAASENERGALLLGWSANRLAAAGWVLSSMLAGLLAILVAPITSLTPTNFTLFIIPALAAALCGRFESFPIAAIAGMALGMADQLLIYVQALPDFTWLPQGSRQALPFVVIVLVLALSGKQLPVRGEALSGRLPHAPRPFLTGWRLGGFGLIFAAGLVLLDYEWRQAITTTLIGTAVALSVVVLTGYVGQISLAQMTIAGASAFALTKIAGDWHIPFPIGPVLAALVGTVLGLIVALPALRIRGLQLAVVTLAFAWMLDQMLFNNASVIGNGGQSTAPQPSLFGLNFGPLAHFPLGDNKVPTVGFGVFVLVVVLLLMAGVANLRRSSTGRRLLAIRSNERAAAAAGIDVVRAKFLAFGVSSFIAGIAGCLLAYTASGSVSPESFAVMTSLTAIALAYLGGIASVGGAVIAGLIMQGGLFPFIGEQLFHIEPWEQLAAGIGLVAAAVGSPSGAVGAFGELRGLIPTWRRRNLDPPARSTLPAMQKVPL